MGLNLPGRWRRRRRPAATRTTSSTSADLDARLMQLGLDLFPDLITAPALAWRREDGTIETDVPEPVDGSCAVFYTRIGTAHVSHRNDALAAAYPRWPDRPPPGRWFDELGGPRGDWPRLLLDAIAVHLVDPRPYARTPDARVPGPS